MKLLDERQVWFEVLPHREAFTAQDVAHASHVSGKRLAKVVLVREGVRSFFMCVMPAAAHLDFAILKRMTGRQELGLASEEEISRLFPDCDLGAMPPFASLYGMPLYLDACFRSEPDVYFQAGNHHEVIRMRYADFERLAGPPAGVFCMHGALHVAHV
jgi:Ala-tRNA(Pro) deacylase